MYIVNHHNLLIKTITDNSHLPWLLILGSSLSSIFGATIVYLDIPVQRFTKYKDFSFSENKRFITSVLSLSGGILFYSSQMILLPEAYETVKSVPTFESCALLFTLLFYSIGIGFILIINKLINYIAPSAIACPCSHEEDKLKNVEFAQFINSQPSTPGSMNSAITLSETSPLSRGSSSSQVVTYSTLPRPCPPGRCLSAQKNPTLQTLECQCEYIPILGPNGETVWAFTLFQDMTRFSHTPCHATQEEAEADRCNCYEPIPLSEIKVKRTDVEQYNLMFSVGIQTAVAITLHKLPEGLITIMGSQSNILLGIGLFIGIFCHNLPEGFMLAIPIYAATSSRNKAFLFASLIGGFTQPLGGLLGLFLLDKIEQNHLNTFNAVLFPLTSGIMVMVILKSILPAVERQLEKKKDIIIPSLFFVLGFGFMALFTRLFGDI